MFQEFDAKTTPETGAPRLSKLREVLVKEGLSGFLVPRADAHQGENVAACSERLSWLTSFTGSAGFCAALQNTAGVFIDGRYTIQVKDQVDMNSFVAVDFPKIYLGDWLAENLEAGDVFAYDPWLHGYDEINKLEKRLSEADITLKKSDNLVDRIWEDRPAPPKGRIVSHSLEFAGESHESKRKRIADDIRNLGLDAFVLTLPDSIAWLLNIRGADIARTPVALCFAVIHNTGEVDLFVDLEKCDEEVRKHLGEQVRLHPEEAFLKFLNDINGPVGVDRTTAPVMISDNLGNVVWSQDPCALPKAIKNETEIEGARAAHIRDGAAMAEFLCWLDQEGPNGKETEISIAQKLETFRRATNVLRDISFETISGAGPNGAVVHYRVNEDSNRTLKPGEIMLVDSGAQYEDGTTDITRTVAIGDVPEGAARMNTLVLKGMIAITRACFPNGITGRELDSFARMNLWQSGFDYAHATGHGVGSYLGVHEGPQRLAKFTKAPFEAGMILSNEPGYYREGAYGIRIENLIVVRPEATPEGGELPMHSFETLTFVPLDRRLIEVDMLDRAEREWVDNYHQEVWEKISPNVTENTREWLKLACEPL